uniref:Uncharacterized protein n=1 Tax=Sphaerodactylus townsendi TaxID=933632 RepID=A0ACB8EV65_9SAUR
MVPSEAYQYKGVVHLLHHFRWTWIGLLAMDDDRGNQFLQTIVPILTENSICSAFTFKLPKATYMEEVVEEMTVKLSERYQYLMDRKTNVLFLYGEPPVVTYLRIIFTKVVFTSLTPLSKVWIISSHWDFESLALQNILDMETLHGTLSFTVHSNQLPGFQEFLQTIRPFWAEGDGFIQIFWEQAFGCSLKHKQEDVEEICTGEEKLESLPGTSFEMHMTGYSYNVYNAVYAAAHALHNINIHGSKHRRLAKVGRLDVQNIQPWQLHHCLKRTLFNNSAGESVRFDKNRELVTVFDLTNWLIFPNGSFARVKVGRLDPFAPSDNQLTLNDDRIVWHRGFKEVRCSDWRLILKVQSLLL